MEFLKRGLGKGQLLCRKRRPHLRAAEEVSLPRRNWKFWAGARTLALSSRGLGYWAWQVFFSASRAGLAEPTRRPARALLCAAIDPNTLPDVSEFLEIRRTVDLDTNIPDRGSDWVSEYTVQRGLCFPRLRINSS